MRQVLLSAEYDISVEERPTPELASGPAASGRDAIVRVVAACVCGSDLWRYRGIAPLETSPRPMGHEFVGVVEAVGSAVERVAVGDFVISPFYVCDGTCATCQRGVTQHCLNGGFWGAEIPGEGYATATQAEYVRVPLADGTLHPLDAMPESAMIPGLLTLSDVMGTGHHAAVSAGVQPGATVAVIGDGAVGLCGVIAAKRLGASRIIAFSRHADRQALARRFGADDIIAERGDEGVALVKEMFDGIGPDCVLECVGTQEAMDMSLQAARPGGQVGFVGLPHGGSKISVGRLFSSNVGVKGGTAAARNYIGELLPEVLSGAIEPGLVFDLELSLDDAAEAYAAMDQRRSIKALLRP